MLVRDLRRLRSHTALTHPQWSIPAGAPAQFPPGFVGCIPSEKSGTINRLTASYSAGFVFDISIFVLTLARAVHLRLLSARIPLVSLIMRDGIVYFLCVFRCRIRETMD
jgi:hypothetical protein